jgi:hypothetical protein
VAHLKNLTQLKAAGGVVSREPVKRQVTWKHVSQDGEEMEDTFDVWVIRASIGTELAIHKESEKDREYVLTCLAKRVMLENDKGKPITLPYEEWDSFDPTLALAIFQVAREVSSGPKNSQPLKNSSVNLSSADLAEDPSKKPETV